MGISALPQAPNPGADLNRTLGEATDGRLKVRFEFRDRFESHTGNNFGLDPDLLNPVLRTRFGLEFRASEWLKVTALAQNCRAPLYGAPAPAGVRDSVDLHEGYFELRPGSDTGWGALLGPARVRDTLTCFRARLSNRYMPCSSADGP